LEHLLRDDEDWKRHMDYIQYNLVKHDYIKSPRGWLHSSFRQAIEEGLYAPNWGVQEANSISRMDLQFFQNSDQAFPFPMHFLNLVFGAIVASCVRPFQTKTYQQTSNPIDSAKAIMSLAVSAIARSTISPL
jgi:hypothetical protein